MQIIYHPDRTRGFRDMGWIKLYQSFNPGRPPVPDRSHFGSMIIFDNGIIAPGGKGFGMHPHQDMEIASVVVSGTMVHSDTAGHNGVALRDSVQLISAGSGVMHSEYNHSPTEPVDNLQIWFLPRAKGLPPHYQKMVSGPDQRNNRLQLLLSPGGDRQSLRINQDVWLWRGTFDRGQPIIYRRQLPGNGLYVFVIEGQADIAGQQAGRRDAVGLPDSDQVVINPRQPTDILVIDVPMQTSFA